MMKKSLFAFAVVGSFFLAACSAEVEIDESNNEEGTEQSNEDSQDEAEEASIAGDWALTDFDPGAEVPAEEQEMFEQSKQEMIDVTKYSFGEDGSMHVVTSMLGQTIEYDQTYSIEGNKLTTKGQDGEEVHFSFTLSGDELAIMQDNDGLTMTMTFARQ